MVNRSAHYSDVLYGGYYIALIYSDLTSECIAVDASELTPEEKAAADAEKAEYEAQQATANAEARRTQIAARETVDSVGYLGVVGGIYGLYFATAENGAPYGSTQTLSASDSSTWWYFDSAAFLSGNYYGISPAVTWSESKFNGWTAEQIYDYAFGSGAFQTYLNSTVKTNVEAYISEQLYIDYCRIFVWLAQCPLGSSLDPNITPQGRSLGSLVSKDWCDAITYEWDYIQKLINREAGKFKDNTVCVNTWTANGVLYDDYYKLMPARYIETITMNSDTAMPSWWTDDLTTEAGWRSFVSRMPEIAAFVRANFWDRISDE